MDTLNGLDHFIGSHEVIDLVHFVLMNTHKISFEDEIKKICDSYYIYLGIIISHLLQGSYTSIFLTTNRDSL